MARRKNWVTKWKKKKGVQQSGGKGEPNGAPGTKPDQKVLHKKAVRVVCVCRQISACAREDVLESV